MAKPQVFARELALGLNRQIGPEAAAARLAEFSRQAVAEVIARGEGSANYLKFVNGREGAPEETVRAPGPILYLFNWWPEVLIALMAFLRQRSPASSPDSPQGRLPYRDRFFVLANGEGVNPRQYRTIPPDAEVIVGNSAPYNRKIDVQMMGREPISINVPPGIMEDGVDLLKARFGRLVEAKRVYTLEFTGQWKIRRGPSTGKLVHSPGIVMKLRG